MTNTGTTSRPMIATAVALSGLLALTQPSPASAAHGGGGGFHGGGGGFHGGGGGEFHRGFGGFHGGRFGAAAVAGPYFYGWGGDPFQSYGDSEGYTSSEYWYYCQDPAGYYPYVSQCNTAWQPIPAG